MSYADLAQFGNYSPASIGWGGVNDPEAHPDLLVPFTHSGAAFGPMHRSVVPVFAAVLDELVPLIPGGLVAGQCGCYNPGSVTVGGSRSFHTYAIAIDVNWGANPMYAPAHPTGLHALPTATSLVARKYGCEWGGDWSYPQDWMHLECHLTPAQARAVKPLTPIGDDMSAADVEAINKHMDARFDALSAGLTRRLDGVIKPLLDKIDAAVEPQTPSKGA
jgi:D-alanyl-D-alanine carboxypeptidase-like protein